MEYTRFVGWDVHGATIAVAHAVPGRGPAIFEGTLPTDPVVVRRWVERQPDRATLRVCYEAGPTGYGWARQLAAWGVACEVVAPGLVPVKATDRVKTDRRDAIKLAEALRAGTLTPVRVPSPPEEAFRDLVRARTTAVQDQTRVRHRVKSALLRWGVRPPADRRPWGAPYLAWVRAYLPEDPARATSWGELLGTLEEADARVRRLTAALEARWPQHPLAPLIRALQALRGINWLTAVILVAECGDGAQFAHPRALMSFWGLVPTEASSGATQHRGGITKTGNAHVRRVLVESAHTYRFAPSLHGLVGRRLAACGPWEPALSAISWRAQTRVHARLSRLMVRRGKPKALAAVARELTAYIWEVSVWVRAQSVVPEEVAPVA